MSLEATTKRQLVDAREKIIAQMAQLEFRVAGSRANWRRRGPQDRGDIYDERNNELREIDELLGLDSEDEG
jgi:hypothetical protein